jgi:hypothetical protein
MLKVLQKPPSLGKMLGPSILFVALSLNGGEMLLWPNIIANYSLTLLWFVPIILTLQWATNIEISRLTAYNGKNILSEITNNILVRYFLLFVMVLTLAWPAWVSVAGGTIVYLLGINNYYAPVVSIILLLALYPAWKSKSYYKVLENIAKYGLLLVLIAVVTVLIYLSFTNRLSFRFENVWTVKQSDFALLYAAVAYGGVAGVLNFVQADWIKSKNYAGSSGHIDWGKKESRNNWKRWQSQMITEHSILFWIGNFAGILMIALVAAALLPKTTVTGFAIIIEQMNALKNISPILPWLWGVGVVGLFMMAQLTILDTAGRLWVNMNRSGENTKPKISRAFLFLGVVILLISFVVPAFRQPAQLLQISAGMASASFSFLPLMVMYYNNKLVPKFARANILQNGLLIATSLFYGIMTALFLISLFS